MKDDWWLSHMFVKILNRSNIDKSKHHIAKTDYVTNVWLEPWANLTQKDSDLVFLNVFQQLYSYVTYYK